MKNCPSARRVYTNFLGVHRIPIFIIMSKKIIETKSAPSAIGPYSQAVTANGVVYCSGQIGLIPETGEFVADDVASQTRQVCAFSELNIHVYENLTL